MTIIVEVDPSRFDADRFDADQVQVLSDAFDEAASRLGLPDDPGREGILADIVVGLGRARLATVQSLDFPFDAASIGKAAAESYRVRFHVPDDPAEEGEVEGIAFR